MDLALQGFSMAVCMWQPKFSTREVLISTAKVREGKNYVFFACDKGHPDLYSYDGTKVKRECKITSNGKIYCYNIPLDWLENEGELPAQLVEVREKEIFNFNKKMRRGK